MLLTATTDSLDIVLGSNVVTNQLPFTVGFNDYTSSAVTPTKNVSVTNNTTAVNLIAAPASNHQRQLRYCSIYNNDTAISTVTIQFNDNSTNRKVFSAAILPGESVQYTFEKGWWVCDANGAEKITGYTLPPAGLRMPEYFNAINASTTLTLTSGTDFAIYLGKADRSYSSINVTYRVTTALGATITWAELAIYKTTPTVGSNATITPRCGFTDCSAIFNGTGIKTTAVAVSNINQGDDLWAVFGSVTSGTNMVVRAGVVDDIGAGFLQTVTGSLRPSTNNSLALTLQSGTALPWVSWQGI